MKLSAWRVALRLARRDALRAKGRSALVIAMIAIPVVGVAGADVTYRSSQLTVQQQATRIMGTGQAYVQAEQLGWRAEQSPDPSGGLDIPSDDGRTAEPTAQERARAREPLADQLRQALPAGVRLLPITSGGMMTVSTAHGVLSVDAQAFDAADPLSHGMVVLDQGRWPTADGQVAASTAFLADSGLKVGQTTTPADSRLALTITAAVEFPGELRDDQLVLRPDDLRAVAAAQEAGDPSGGGQAGPPQEWLLRMPGNAAFTWANVLQANDWGFSVTSRAVLQDPPPRSAVPLYRSEGAGQRSEPVDSSALVILSTVVGMALLEIVLLAGPAFAVGARRSRRQLGLLAAGGGDRAHIRAVVLGGGLVLGATGALVGLVVGAVAVALGRGELESLSGSRFGGYTLRPLDLVGIVLVGVVTGLLAAVVPAVQAARQDVVSSLTGRGAVKAPPKWLTVLGALGVGGGAVIALLGVGVGQGGLSIVGGSVIAELGVVACTPFLVGLFGRLARLLPLGPRLALRDSARNRGRTAPAVAAVLAAVAGAVAVSVYQSSSDTAARAAYQPSGPLGSVTLQFDPGDSAAQVASENSAVQSSVSGLGTPAGLYKVYYRGDCDQDSAPCGAVSVQPSGCPVPGGPTESGTGCAQEELQAGAFAQSVVAAGAAALPDLLGLRDPAAAQALAAGKVLVTDPNEISDGKVVLDLEVQSDPDGDNDTTRTTQVALPAVLVAARVQAVQALLSPAAAARAGLGVHPLASVWLPSKVPGSAEEQRMNAALSRVVDGSWLSVERGYQSSDSAITIGLALAAGVVAVGAAAIATGLAAADSQADLATLAAVGAAPGIRRRLSGFQCAVTAAMGTVLGAAAGIVPAWALWRYRNRDAAGYGTMAPSSGHQASPLLVVPWGTLAALVVGLPLLAWLLAAGFTRSRVQLTRRTG